MTREFSDWSVAPVSEWFGKLVTVRGSRKGDALTIRAKSESEKEFRMVRLAYLDPSKNWKAGPLCCAPVNQKLTVEFFNWMIGFADEKLHEDYEV